MGEQGKQAICEDAGGVACAGNRQLFRTVHRGGSGDGAGWFRGLHFDCGCRISEQRHSGYADNDQ